MPTLLQINSVANIGSTGRIANQIGDYAIRNGWRSFIAFGRDFADSKSQLITIGNRRDIITHFAGSRIFDLHGMMSKHSTRDFIKNIEKIKPDIVHIHNLHGYYINYSILLEYLKSSGIPVIATMHDFWLMTGHCAYINDSCKRWITGYHDCPRTNSYPASLFDKSRRNWDKKSEILNSMNNLTLVPVSYWLNSKLKLSMLNGLKSHVIQNGIDTTMFTNTRNIHKQFPDRHSDKFRILCVATKWTASNGYADILTLASHLRDDARIIIVGVTQKQILQLPDNMVGIEYTNNIEELITLYSQSDLLINPNREVTFGLVTAEAMACGTPAVVFKDTAGEEVVGDYGYCIRESELVDFINNLQRPSLPRKEDCIAYIKENFNSDIMLKKYFTLYKNITSPTIV